MFNISRKNKNKLIKDEHDNKDSMLNNIEEMRSKINEMINLGNNTMFDDEMVKVSQHLDKLIVEYMCAQGINKI